MEIDQINKLKEEEVIKKIQDLLRGFTLQEVTDILWKVELDSFNIVTEYKKKSIFNP